ncbi:hypothetical protein LEP1GSC150_0839, partial [Leptospira interrogans serovar Copenhageni str. LT2050]
ILKHSLFMEKSGFYKKNFSMNSRYNQLKLRMIIILRFFYAID